MNEDSPKVEELREEERLREEVEALRRQLDEAQAATAEVRGQLAAAITAARDAVRAANPQLPGDLIDGSTLEEIVASVERARAVREQVLATVQQNGGGGQVPVGGAPAPPVRPSTEGMTGYEKIRLGLEQKQKGR